MIFDTHVHLWGAPGKDPSRLPGARPVADGPFEARELLADMDACGVTGAVLVAPLIHGFDASYALAQRDAHLGRFAVLARVDLRVDPARAVAGLAARGAAGVRLHAVAQRSERRDRGLCRALREHGLLLSVYAPLQRARLERLAGALAPQPLLVDHLALPAEPAADALPRAHALVDALASASNVVLKVSALPLLTRVHGRPGVAELIGHAARVWGARRLVWGSDMPRMREFGLAYAQQLALARELLGERIGPLVLHDRAAELFSQYVERSRQCTTTAC